MWTWTKRFRSRSGPSSSPFFSPRIQSLRKRRNDFGSELEFEIESSKPTWTEASVATTDVEDDGQRVRDSVAFEELKEHPEWGPFFRRQPYELEIGGKIAEGGQAEILEALGTNKRDERYGEGKARLVVKVFKKGYFLEDLQRWWPPGLASAALPIRYFGHICGSKNNKFIPVKRYGLCWSVGIDILQF